MTTLNVNALEPEGATTSMGVGLSGQNTIIGGNTIKLNTLKDAGGNTIFTSDGSGNLSSVNSAFGSGMALILSQTADGDATISFTANIDSTYTSYLFKFYNINPVTDGAYFQFQAGSGTYDTTTTTTYFHAEMSEGGADPSLANIPAETQAQGTDFQSINYNIGNGGDESMAGELYLFNPASTTYAKNFYSRAICHIAGDRIYNSYMAGYFNTASAITQVQFKMDSGNFDGIIKMFGMK